MDYAEKVLNELIDKYENISKEDYLEIYNKAMMKKEVCISSLKYINVDFHLAVKTKLTSISYAGEVVTTDLVVGYEKSQSERNRPWAA